MREPGSVFTDLGYLVEQCHRASDDRYNVFTLTKQGGRGGRKFIGKEIAPAASDAVRKVLRGRQNQQVKFYRRINALHDLSGCVRCPRVIRVDRDFECTIVEHFADAFYPRLGSELTDLQYAEPGELLGDAKTFAAALAQLDYALMRNQRTSFRCVRLSDALGAWKFLQEGISADRINASLVERGRKVIDEHQQYIAACPQHCDMQPLHWFRLSPAEAICTEVGLIDSERSKRNNPRFYDLANMYARLHTLAGSPDAAQAMLREFMRIQLATPNEVRLFWQSFLPVVTLRSIAMLADAYCHEARGVAFYLEAAEDLIERCLTQNIERLIDK